MRLRVLLADDEEAARDRLRGLLGGLGEIEIVGEAHDGRDAAEQIEATRPDLVFMDIEMPERSGMEVVASLPPPRPAIIFCTAYDQYAIDAFEQHAADYLLKPVSRERLAKAVERVRIRLEENESRRREFEDATRTQARLLPQRLPAMSALSYAGLSVPARGVGGDYYDFLDLGNGALGLVLADVSGKGLFAGLLMASLQARIQSLAIPHGREPERLVREANHLMFSSTDSNRYATCFYGTFDDESRKLTYVNAGHLPPLVLRRREARGSRAVQWDTLRLEGNGTAIGLLAESRYRQSSIEFRPGDLLCAFTDGVTETRDEQGCEFGEAGLASVLMRHASALPDALCRHVLAELERFGGASARGDDVTLIVGRVE